MHALRYPLAALVLFCGGCAGETTGSGPDSGGVSGSIATDGGAWAMGGRAAGGAAVGGSLSTGGSVTTGGSGTVACPGLPFSIGTGGDACAGSSIHEPPPLNECEYQLPVPPSPLDVPDYRLVQVLHTPVNGPTEEVGYASARGGCSAEWGGWYYDVPPSEGAPSKIIICPCTCASFATGTVDILYGCHPALTPLL
jgi:hypothetical protein